MATDTRDPEDIKKRCSDIAMILREMDRPPSVAWDLVHSAKDALVRAAWCRRHKQGLFAPDGLYNYGATEEEALENAERLISAAEMFKPQRVNP